MIDEFKQSIFFINIIRIFYKCTMTNFSAYNPPSELRTQFFILCFKFDSGNVFHIGFQYLIWAVKRLFYCLSIIYSGVYFLSSNEFLELFWNNLTIWSWFLDSNCYLSWCWICALSKFASIDENTKIQVSCVLISKHTLI